MLTSLMHRTFVSYLLYKLSFTCFLFYSGCLCINSTPLYEVIVISVWLSIEHNSRSGDVNVPNISSLCSTNVFSLFLILGDYGFLFSFCRILALLYENQKIHLSAYIFVFLFFYVESVFQTYWASPTLTSNYTSKRSLQVLATDKCENSTDIFFSIFKDNAQYRTTPWTRYFSEAPQETNTFKILQPRVNVFCHFTRSRGLVFPGVHAETKGP